MDINEFFYPCIYWVPTSQYLISQPSSFSTKKVCFFSPSSFPLGGFFGGFFFG